MRDPVDDVGEEYAQRHQNTISNPHLYHQSLPQYNNVSNSLPLKGKGYKYQTHSATVACLYPPACHNIFAMAVISAL